MRYLVVSKKKYPSWLWGWDRKICPSWSPIAITRQASWCQSVILRTDFSIPPLYSWWILIVPVKCLEECNKWPYLSLCSLGHKSTMQNQNYLYIISRIPPDCHHPSRLPHRCHFGPCQPCRQICGKAYPNCSHQCPAMCHAAVIVVRKDNVSKLRLKYLPVMTFIICSLICWTQIRLVWSGSDCHLGAV